MSQTSKSAAHFARARNLIPNGVSSPMRAFVQVGSKPIVAASAKGSRITDVDGKVYVDFLNAFGALLLGHARDEVVTAIAQQAARGSVYGLSSEPELQLADKIVRSTPAVEQVRFVCSGTEAVMTAARIARAHTGRSLLLKFAGAYHGHADALLASPHNLAAAGANKGGTQGLSDVLNREVILCEYNDSAQLGELFASRGDQIAAVLVEPIATNMGFVAPEPGFHAQIRDLCNKHGSLFIFDEVVTGFRFNFGGVCGSFGVDPDLVTFGKIIGGGTPVGAYGGKARFMANVAIGGKVFQSGTFAANPLTMAAGNAALDVLAAPGFYAELEAKGAWLQAALSSRLAAAGIPFHVARHGALLGVAYRDDQRPMRSYLDVKTQRYELFAKVHASMLERGFLLAPSLEEPLFLSAAHTAEELESFASAYAESLQLAMAERPRAAA